MTAPPVAIVAGGGALPLEIARAARAAGREAVLFRIEGEADAEPGDIPHHTLGYGRIGRFFELLAEHGVEEICFAGTIARRPHFSGIAGDLGTIRRLPRILKVLAGGDDGVIRKVLRLFEEEGYRVVGIAEIAPALLAGTGPHGRHHPRAEDRADIALGARFLAAAAPFDVGQAVVAVAGRIVAVEAAEGTDAMLERAASLRRRGRFLAGGRQGVLVKLPKTGQDRRTDLPVVGLATVERAEAAGLAGLALAAGGTLFVERGAALARADGAGLFVEGIEAEAPA